MTNLSKLGQRLLNRLQKISPEFSQGFRPGISREEVNAFLEPLQYTLPNDFYELYEWRNGHSDYFNQPVRSAMICQFSSTNFVAESKKWEVWGNEAPTYKGRFLLPFIEEDSRYFAIAMGRSYNDEAHIVYVSREGETTLRYDSITSMLISTIRCFEENAFYVDENGFLNENYRSSSEILRSENPKILTEAMSDIMAGFDIYGLDDESDQGSYGDLVSPLLSALETLRWVRPPGAIAVVQSGLDRLQNKSSDRAYSARYAFNRWLSDVELAE
ncbi:MAG: SMI1/KNR4 family protein [Phormidesmis sp. CAN_BIN36]|nr:SMI1/KNR4 family protein [Phormidesmis sp. CAN_BIN36]